MAERKKKKSTETFGYVHIKSTFNNCIVTVTDKKGTIVSWSAGGNVGFKGSRKSTPYAAQLAADKAAKEALESGMKEVEVYVKGAGAGRETAVRAVHAAGLRVRAIRDVTPLPHNGCRPRKKRRV